MLSTELDDEQDAIRDAPVALGLPDEAETAPPPAPAPESAPQPKPATAVDLLAQVKQGQVTRPALDAAFGPPKTPPNEPGASAFPPKMGEAQGLDWKGLADRLSAARNRQASLKTHDNVLNNINSVLNPRFHSDSGGDAEVAGAEDELKLGQAKQKMGDEQAAAEGRTAKSQTDAAELERRRQADNWKRIADGLNRTDKRTDVAAKEAGVEATKKTEGDSLEATKAAYLDTAEGKRSGLTPEKLAGVKTLKDFQLLTSNIDAAPKPHGTGPGLKAKAAADKAAKATENVDTAADEIHDGRMTTMDLKGRDPEFRKAVTVAMNKKYPEDSLAKHQRFNEAYDEYASAKPGTAGGRLQASKTAMEHIGQMAEQFKKLDNGNSEAINSLKNKLAVEMGFGSAGDAVKAFEAGTAVTAGETAGAYGANTEGGHEHFAKIFSPNTKPSQAAAAMEMIREQMATRNRQADAALRQFAQSPGQHKMIDELGLVQKSADGKASPKEGDESKLASGVPIVFRGGKWVKK